MPSRVSLPVQGPYDLEATVRLLQRRPNNRIDVWSAGEYRRVLRAGDGLHLCTVRNEGTIDAPELKLRVEPRPGTPASLHALERTLQRMLGLAIPPGFELPVRNAKLVPLARVLRGARPPRFPTLFETFGRIIPYQQVSLDSGSAIVSRLVERFGERLETEVGPAWAFPDSAAILNASERDFAGVGLSRTKLASLRHVAGQISKGELTEEELSALPVDAALRRLDALPGVGPWTAAIVLLRGLGRTEVFPEGDVGAQKGLGAILGDAAAVHTLIERAGNRRGYLYFYSLGAQLLSRGLLTGSTRDL